MRELELNLLNPDFVDFLKALHVCGVESMLVGGYAVVLSGYHRTTGDLDVWVNPKAANFDALMRAFDVFGLPRSAFSQADFLSPDRVDVFTFGRPPVAIDILTQVKGLCFEDAFRKAELVSVDGAPLRLLSPSCLRRAKLAAGRHKDLDDLENLNIPDEPEDA